MSRFITLLTDFGTADGYVGEMKGMLLSACPDATLVDIAHDVAPQDVDGARLAVARYWRRFVAGTVHLVVVDPGVGGSRAAIAVESEGLFLVGPDNGVLSPALLHGGSRCVELPVPPGASPTFHGRDVFAPATAALARGTSLDSLGDPYTSPMVRRTPEARRRDDGAISGVVISVDRFGNAVTNLVAWRGGVLEVAGRVLPIVRTYADVAPGDEVAIVGSSGLVEVAVRDGSAARRLRLARGNAVVLRPG
jgi:S-adenosyl-L-methionine hydrolase (adenosine-forming)